MAQPAETDTALLEAARQLAPGHRTEWLLLKNGETPIHALRLLDAGGQPDGYVFRSRDLAPPIQGYAGPIDLAIAVSTGGVLKSCLILDSRETPSFIRRVKAWMPSLARRRLFAPSDIRQVDTVTGATLSSRAILDTLDAAGRRFEQLLAGQAAARTDMPADEQNWHLQAVFLLLAAAGAVGLHSLAASRTIRRLWLLAMVVGFGAFGHLQYSMDPLIRLICLELPSPGLTVPFLLVFGIPLLTLLFGNLYCGWLCPFGALQELLGDWPASISRLDPPAKAWTRIRRIKYGLLLGLILAALTGITEHISSLDPLTHAFQFQPQNPYGIFLIALLILSVFFRRFWCRNLCPTGAALSLLGRLRLLRRPALRILPARCDLGIEHARAPDCLLCDRCRQSAPQPPGNNRSSRLRAGLLLTAIGLALGLWILCAG